MDGVESGSSEVVVVGVLTYRRPDSLARLLPELVAQVDRLERGSACAARVLVVDNDPSGSARSLVEALQPRVRYAHEPTPGIAVARARAVLEAHDADVLVFIDDDEEPRPGWLVQMVGTWRSHGRPAGVAGRVLPVYPGEMDPWVAAGGFFTRRSYPTGTRVPAASSANLLLDLALLRRLDLTFDSRLGLRGGEDTLLTRTLTARGHDLIWCNEAEVTNVIPPSRMSRRWVLRRAYSHGVVASRVELALSPHPRLTRFSLMVGSVARICAGLAEAAAGLGTRRIRHHAHGLRTVYRGAGLLNGALGRDLIEYHRTSAPSRSTTTGTRAHPN